MDANERKALRERAERERDDDSPKSAHYAQARSPAWWALMESLDGTRVLALLDALEAAERKHHDDVARLADDLDATLEERDELAAEIAAYQGRPEGALEGWTWEACDRLWVRELRDPASGALRILMAGLDGSWGTLAHGTAPTPRAAMRAAEAAARARGLL